MAIRGYAKWEKIEDDVKKEMKNLGLPVVTKPKEEAIPPFPSDVSALGGDDVMKLMGVYELWAGYLRSLLGNVDIRKMLWSDIRKRVFARIMKTNRDKYDKVTDAKNDALLDKDIMELDFRIKKDEIKSDKLQELVETYEKYVRVLSRQLTHLGNELEFLGDSGIYAGDSETRKKLHS